MNKPNRYRHLLLATADQSRETDRLTIESLGIPGDTLMEIAGNRSADVISSDFPTGSTVLFVCGKGNNAGDALVAARLLLNDGYQVIIYPVMGTDGLSVDAERNRKRLLHIAGEMGTEIPFWDRWKNPQPADVIVDGIFGTGLKSAVRQPVSDVITRINESGKPVYALDIPSGLNCDTGDVQGIAVNAVKTLQFGLRKLGCYLGDGPSQSGDRLLLPLPFPDIYMQDITVRLLDEAGDPKQLLKPARPAGIEPSTETFGTHSAGSHIRQLHKYNNGVVHVIGGSPGLTGAPLYAARAAWSAGMGAVTLIHPAKWLHTMDVQAPELIKKPIGSDTRSHFTENDADEVLSLISEKKGIVVLGPGIGREDQTMAFVRKVIRESEGPLIIDADGLHAIHGHNQTIKKRQHPSQVILTPHSGELSHLTGKAIKSDSVRYHEIVALARSLGCTIIGKGNPVIVHSALENQTLFTGYDTSLFARAGFGDILAGYVAAFFSRTGDAAGSSENGLLFGYEKLIKSVSGGNAFPEPSDLT